MARGRPPIDKAKRARDQRRAVINNGLLACYQVIDMARKELAELDAADLRTIAKRHGRGE